MNPVPLIEQTSPPNGQLPVALEGLYISADRIRDNFQKKKKYIVWEGEKGIVVEGRHPDAEAGHVAVATSSSASDEPGYIQVPFPFPFAQALLPYMLCRGAN